MADPSRDENVIPVFGKSHPIPLKLEPSEQEAIETSKIRKFIVPQINFKAQTYPDLIDWEHILFSEPPLTIDLSSDEIRSFIDEPLKVPAFPCHTQSVERAIKLVTEAAGSVFGVQARDGFIRQRIRSRKQVSCCDSKAAFFPILENSK